MDKYFSPHVLLFLGILCFLSGCITVDKTTGSQRRACVSACEKQLTVCEQVCTDTCEACEKAAVEKTKKSYERYEKQRCIEGKTLIRRLQSYHDPLQCRKTTCHCVQDFQVCTQACYGTIEKQWAVEKNCC